MQKLTDAQIEENLKKLDGWEYINGAIETTFEFKDFKDAFSVMTRIAFECEKQNHHPDWTNVYNKLNIRLNTHDADGITDNDIKLAHTIEEIITSE
ncbi:4a-hydroxytetrahydrobiopterin dehydratase [uncultured Maribacter sp.]|uniref:4a-hydroxytetrahydrobiopterin dehydratase n=1 Tax=uncultured Maribacter sp. TaxID=431308 RepID=UPI00262A9627|nr:4a-hydroxytetrahydrobiopterin dehydratase [uncultured Maribacter sp.]